ncbi:unnamed protein product [Closterium sp. NIES-64]|nr:unnamed protein product [Closterium sp. NIES-64]
MVGRDGVDSSRDGRGGDESDDLDSEVRYGVVVIRGHEPISKGGRGGVRGSEAGPPGRLDSVDEIWEEACGVIVKFLRELGAELLSRDRADVEGGDSDNVSDAELSCKQESLVLAGAERSLVGFEEQPVEGERFGGLGRVDDLGKNELEAVSKTQREYLVISVHEGDGAKIFYERGVTPFGDEDGASGQHRRG